MARLIGIAAIVVLLMGLCAVTERAVARAGDGGVGVTTVDVVVDDITQTLEDQGFEISLIVDHAAAAASIGETLRDTTLIMARMHPLKERRLMRRGRTVGIDLPVKFLVFEDESGEIQIRNNAPGYLIDRHDLLVGDPIVWMMERDTEQFGDQDHGLVTVESNQGHAATVQALQDAISRSGNFAIPLVLDLASTAQRGASATRRATVIVFGNPAAGTPLMQTTQEIALDLPQKFLVRTTGSGDVLITFNDPFYVAKRHGVSGQDTLLGNIANTLQSFAEAGAGEAPDQ